MRLADATATVALLTIALEALWIFDVRDWRCYSCVLLWLPMGIAAAGALAVKLFLWPMLVWLLATRRYRAAVSAAAGTVLLVLVPWAALQFQGFSAYPRLLRTVDRFQGPHSYTIAALGERLDLNPTVSVVAMFLFAAVVIVVTVREGRRGNNSLSFAAAITAALMTSPIVGCTTSCFSRPSQPSGGRSLLSAGLSRSCS